MTTTDASPSPVEPTHVARAAAPAAPVWRPAQPYPWERPTRTSAWRGVVGAFAGAADRRHALYGLAVIRVVYGLVVLLLIGVNARDQALLWGPGSPWTPDAARESVEVSRSFSLYLLSDSPAWSTALVLVTALCAGLLVLGWRSRWVVPVLLVLFYSMYERDPQIVDGGDNLMRIVLVYLLVADTSAVWSLDALRRRGRGRPASAAPRTATWWRLLTVLHNGAVVAVVLQVFTLYLTSALFKAQGGTWQDGSAVYYAMRVYEFSPFPWLSRLFYVHATFVTVASYFTVLFQLAFPYLMLHPVTRRVALLMGIGLHLGIAVFMGLPFFSLTMLASEAVLVTDRGWATLARVLRRATGQRPAPAGTSLADVGAVDPASAVPAAQA